MVEDLRYDEQIASCVTDEDCRLRDGADCCEQCDDVGFIAVSSESPLRDQCPEAPCRTCEHHYDGYRARCSDGSCRVAAACPPGFVACGQSTPLCLQVTPDTDGDGCCGCLNP